MMKSYVFMATAAATLILAVTAPVLMWRNASITNQYRDYKDGVEDKERLLAAIGTPPRSMTLDARTSRLTSRINKFDIVYTLNPGMQKDAEQALLKNDPNYGAIVAIDSNSGAVLAMASYSTKRRAYHESYSHSFLIDPIARNSMFPMASIQKVITAAAAIDTGVATRGKRTKCTGFLRAGDTLIPCSSRFGHGELDLAAALAKSCNVTYGALALDIKRDVLEDYYRRFMFNKSIGFDLPLTESILEVAPGNGGLAKAGSGLDGARVSPLHSAIIAAAVQNKGVMMRPYIVESAVTNGRPPYKAKPQQIARPISDKTAATLASMMDDTVEEGGTGYRKFGRMIEGGKAPLKVMAKTGSLNDNGPAEHYTWFVGFVESGAPRMAFAIMMMSDESRTEKHAVNLARDFFLSVMNAPEAPSNDR